MTFWQVLFFLQRLQQALENAGKVNGAHHIDSEHKWIILLQKIIAEKYGSLINQTLSIPAASEGQ